MPEMTEKEARLYAQTIGDRKTQCLAQILFLILDEVQDINAYIQGKGKYQGKKNKKNKR